jgi:hypothetical protein
MTQITLQEFVNATTTSLVLMCGKARTREIVKLTIDEIHDDGCNGKHPLLHYAEGMRDVIARRGREDEMVALVTAARMLQK